MNTMTVHFDQKDAELVRKFAQSQGVSVSDFIRSAVLEKVEDACDLLALRQAVKEDTGERYGIDQVLNDLS